MKKAIAKLYSFTQGSK